MGLLNEYRKEIEQYKSKGLVSFPFKYYFKWKRSLQPGSSSVKDESAWLTFEVIDFLKKNIKSSDKVFEFGGGGSTLFFLKRVKELVTVEHDEEWFKILKNMVVEKKYTNWKGMFVGASKGNVIEDPKPAVPEHYLSTEEKFAGQNFKDYASSIDQYNNGYFDWVIVDGRVRPSCLMHGISKVKLNGYLILDNSNRGYYLEHTQKLIDKYFTAVVDNYGPSPYNGEFGKTTVWKKIKE